MSDPAMNPDGSVRVKWVAMNDGSGRSMAHIRDEDMIVDPFERKIIMVDGQEWVTDPNPPKYRMIEGVLVRIIPDEVIASELERLSPDGNSSCVDDCNG